MKILIISNMYPSVKDPVYGTFVYSFVENIKLLNQNGITELIVIKGRDGNYLRKISKYIHFYGMCFFELLKKYDLIYVHTITYPIPPILLVSLFRKLPLVFNVHGSDVLTRGKIANYLKKKSEPLLRSAKLIVSPSYFFKNILLKEFPFFKEENIFVSPSGGVAHFFYQMLSISRSKSFTLGYVSRIDEAKGWDVFIVSIAMLKKIDPTIKAIIVGRGTKVNEMQTLIEKFSLREQIQYLGPISYKKLPEIYAQLDVFVFPTCLEESLGLVGLEAMACGVPVIGSRIGGLQDYIRDGENGYFFSAGNAFALTEAIKRYMFLSETEKKRMKNKAKKTAYTYRSDIVSYSLYNQLCCLI